MFSVSDLSIDIWPSWTQNVCFLRDYERSQKLVKVSTFVSAVTFNKVVCWSLMDLLGCTSVLVWKQHHNLLQNARERGWKCLLYTLVEAQKHLWCNSSHQTRTEEQARTKTTPPPPWTDAYPPHSIIIDKLSHQQHGREWLHGLCHQTICFFITGVSHLINVMSMLQTLLQMWKNRSSILLKLARQINYSNTGCKCKYYTCSCTTNEKLNISLVCFSFRKLLLPFLLDNSGRIGCNLNR